MRWTNNLPLALLLFAFQASAENNTDVSFAQALGEARRLVATDPGKTYDEEFAKIVAPRLADIVNECTKALGPKVNFEVVFVFASDGTVQKVLTPAGLAAAKCVGDKLSDLRLPAPPQPNWPVALSINLSPDNAAAVRALDAKFAAQSLTYSRDFYSKVHLVAIANSPVTFKYDRYPSEGPERIQCGDGTYTRQHGKPWVYADDKIRAGLPIDYPERNRYAMTLSLKETWGRGGAPVTKETAAKIDGWIKLVEAALNVDATSAKILSKPETDDHRAQWVFEATSQTPGSVASQLIFRKAPDGKSEYVLLREFSGSMRLEGDKVVPGKAGDAVRLGFGYMMPLQQDSEVSEFVWQEMQQHGGEKNASAAAPTHSNSKEANRYNGSGMVKDQKGDFAGAIADYSRAIELDPKFYEAYYNRGLARKHKGDIDGAIADYDHVIEANPNDPKFARAYSDRGVAKRKKGDVDGAIRDYDRTLELDPKYVIAYWNRGNAKDEKGDTDGALADYNRGFELGPGNAKAYLYRADLLFKKKQYDAALQDVDKAIALEPKNDDAYVALSWYQLFRHEPRESIAASQKALQLSPADAAAINLNLAHAYLFDSQFEKAKAVYSRNKNRKLSEGGRTFAQAALDDFKEFEQAGLTHPDMEKIKALLTAKDP